MSVRSNSSQITWAQRLIGTLLALCLIAGLFPIPVFHAAEAPVGKDASAPFPCLHRACGCRSAKQCWKQCCCFTNQEKVAWARSHRVEVPQYVVEAARLESPSDTNSATCCLKKSNRARGSAVIAIEAARCHGDYWTWAVVSLWAVPAVDANCVDLADEYLGDVPESKLIPCSPAPPVPPPKLGIVITASV